MAALQFPCTLFQTRKWINDYGAADMHGQGEKVTRQECAKILFDEFRHLSRPFAIYGPYRYLIGKMIDHMQYGNGFPFHTYN